MTATRERGLVPAGWMYQGALVNVARAPWLVSRVACGVRGPAKKVMGEDERRKLLVASCLNRSDGPAHALEPHASTACE
ncbi:hypothetical protein [Nannocystis punicea]|uniref:Uncharacterized protein n=1 Tax=Nannocystis punicea TaxID=2995304 RepID=A0ABY7HAR7_9BACT|nr:hypothetical protein [Nannocystis poenicansa]WAS96366.1 hypothetical protein O0S08_09415 [Nannocystis poenicansa]